MNDYFMYLYNLINKNKELIKLESLDLNIKDIDSFTLTILLYPLIDFSDVKLEVNDFVDVDVVRELDDWFSKKSKLYLTRLILVGKDADSIYEEYLKDGKVYEDEIIKTFKESNLVHFSLKDSPLKDNNPLYFDREVVAIMFRGGSIVYHNGYLFNDIVDEEIARSINSTNSNMFSLYGNIHSYVPALFKSMGKVLNELRFYNSLRLYHKKDRDEVINNLNSKFVRSVTKLDYISIKNSRVGNNITSHRVKKIFDNLRLEMFKDLDYREVYKMMGYYKK